MYFPVAGNLLKSLRVLCWVVCFLVLFVSFAYSASSSNLLLLFSISTINVSVSFAVNVSVSHIRDAWMRTMDCVLRVYRCEYFGWWLNDKSAYSMCMRIRLCVRCSPWSKRIEEVPLLMVRISHSHFSKYAYVCASISKLFKQSESNTQTEKERQRTIESNDRILFTYIIR